MVLGFINYAPVVFKAFSSLHFNGGLHLYSRVKMPNKKVFKNVAWMKLKYPVNASNRYMSEEVIS